jgi:hypothetical protein
MEITKGTVRERGRWRTMYTASVGCLSTDGKTEAEARRKLLELMEQKIKEMNQLALYRVPDGSDGECIYVVHSSPYGEGGTVLIFHDGKDSPAMIPGCSWNGNITFEQYCKDVEMHKYDLEHPKVTYECPVCKHVSFRPYGSEPFKVCDNPACRSRGIEKE